MRIVSYFFMVVGMLLLASAGYDEYRGTTHAPSGRYSGYTHYSISKQGRPEEFHNAMIVHLSRSLLLLLAGIVLFMIDRGQERADPLSPDFAGNKALDEWGDAMKKEEERRRHPKP